VRFLTLAECGCSLREAAANIGRNHTTLLKRMKSDRQFGRAFRAAREQARNSPLMQIREASQKSWRAAAWLLNYYDARERGRHVPQGTRRNIRCPTPTPKLTNEHKDSIAGEIGEVSERPPAT
jgi:hypothetical protein